MEYFLTLIFVGFVPPIILLYLARKNVHWKTLFLSVITALLIGTLWDYTAVHRGIWYYTPGEGKTVGIFISGLPIEDFFFFISMPLWGIGFYEFVRNKIG